MINEAKIIDFKDYAEYNKRLSEIIEQASNLSEKIYDQLFDIACSNKWKGWSDNQPEGTKFYVDEEMLRNTGDKNIDLIWELLDKITEVKNNINIKCSDSEN